MKLVSVIVPIYNVEDYLRHCLDSIISQTYQNLEIILVDDGSKDNSGKICDEYAERDKRIKIIHKKNGGLSDARNAGLDIAKGAFITLIDSDDWVDSDYVEQQVEGIEENDADMAITSHKVHYKKRVIDYATKEHKTYKPEEVLERILYSKGVDLSAWAKLYRAELFDNIRYPKGRLYEDAATTYKLIDRSKKIVINSISTYNYRMNDKSISRCDFNPKKMDLIVSTKEMVDFVRAKYPHLARACKRRLKYSELSTYAQLAKSKKLYPEYQEKLSRMIRKGRLSVIIDPKTPSRDKLGLLFSVLGFRMFKLIWRGYEKITARR